MTALSIVFAILYGCYLLAFFAFSIWHSEDKRARDAERAIERQGLHLNRFIPCADAASIGEAQQAAYVLL